MRHRRRRLGSDHSGDLSSLVRGGVAAPECRKLSQTSVVRGRILVTAPLSQKADERLEQLELGATEVRSLDPREGLAEELLGLFVPALCGPYSRERGRRRRDRATRPRRPPPGATWTLRAPLRPLRARPARASGLRGIGTPRHGRPSFPTPRPARSPARASPRPRRALAAQS